MGESVVSVLSGHSVKQEVFNLLESARSRLLLVSAYLEVWPDLRMVLQRAVDRGVPIRVLVREPDRAKEKEKLAEEVAALEELGVRVHRVERLHAKMYVSEQVAIVTSFNLVDASQGSLEVGVLLREPRLVRECEAMASEILDAGAAESRGKERGADPMSRPEGYCIGCGAEIPYDPERPLCSGCYSRSNAGRKCSILPNRMCHRCGDAFSAVLNRPLCRGCYELVSEGTR